MILFLSDFDERGEFRRGKDKKKRRRRMMVGGGLALAGLAGAGYLGYRARKNKMTEIDGQRNAARGSADRGQQTGSEAFGRRAATVNAKAKQAGDAYAEVLRKAQQQSEARKAAASQVAGEELRQKWARAEPVYRGGSTSKAAKASSTSNSAALTGHSAPKKSKKQRNSELVRRRRGAALNEIGIAQERWPEKDITSGRRLGGTTQDRKVDQKRQKKAFRYAVGLLRSRKDYFSASTLLAQFWRGR